MAALTMSTSAVRPLVQMHAATCPRRAMQLVVRVQASKGMNEAAQQAVKSVQLPAALKPAAVAVVANVLMALPAHAEAGKIFDFNLTLPVMAGQFLLLMVFLDKSWFGPVGDILDKRDAYIREKLASVRDNSSELKALQKKAESIVQEARADSTKLLSETKAKVNAEVAEALAKVKAEVDKELAVSIEALNAEEEEAIKNLDAQVQKLTNDILGRILPEGVKL